MLHKMFKKVWTKESLVLAFFLVTASDVRGQSAPPELAKTKPVIGIAEFTTSVRGLNTDGIQSAVENSLAKTRKFTIMERARLATLLKERGLAMGGISTGNATRGGFSGVDYAVYGSVSNASLQENNMIFFHNCVGTLTVNVKVVDVNTGEVRYSDSMTSSKDLGSSTSPDIPPCRGISIDNADFGGAMADGIANKLTMSIFPVKIARITDGGDIYLNYGEGTLSANQLLKVAIMGEGFVDPDTGEKIGADEKIVGIVQVSEARVSYSIAHTVIASEQVAVGNILHPIDPKKSRIVDDCVKAKLAEGSACGSDKQSTSCTKLGLKSQQICSGLLTN